MIKATIERFCHSESATFGWLTTPSGRRYATVERPWLNNKVGVSCIPVGEYICEPTRFNRGGYDAIKICNVDGRTHIKMHIASLPSSVEGCIGINTRFGILYGQWAGVGSRVAFRSLMQELGGKKFKLLITNKESGTL